MSWEDRLKELIAPTASKWPYRVIQVKPNKKLDTEIYTLSGKEADIAANGSLFLALYDLAEWWEQWESGFPLLTERLDTNYAVTSWRKADTRPRYREWKNPTANVTAKKPNYRVIEYWRDRSIESESIPLSGTDLQLIEHIVQIEYEASGSGASSLNGKNSKPPLKGRIILFITMERYPRMLEVSTDQFV